MEVKLLVARHDESIYENYLGKDIEKSESFSSYYAYNEGENDSIFKKYNRLITNAYERDDDILVFVHEDVRILDPNFSKKLQMVFSKKPDVGIVGIVGTKELVQNGWWSNDHKYHVGHWHQEYENGQQRHMIRKIGFDSEMVAVDGCCFAVRGSVTNKIKFDENLYPNSYHFYDYSYCISVLEAGWKVAVADIEILHRSEGPLSQDWHRTKEIFCANMISRGYTFPITKGQIKK